jgi:hypothetical protein
METLIVVWNLILLIARMNGNRSNSHPAWNPYKLDPDDPSHSYSPPAVEPFWPTPTWPDPMPRKRWPHCRWKTLIRSRNSTRDIPSRCWRSNEKTHRLTPLSATCHRRPVPYVRNLCSVDRVGPNLLGKWPLKRALGSTPACRPWCHRTMRRLLPCTATPSRPPVHRLMAQIRLSIPLHFN